MEGKSSVGSEIQQKENHNRLLGLRVDRVWAKLSTPAPTMVASRASQNETARRLLLKNVPVQGHVGLPLLLDTCLGPHDLSAINTNIIF